MSATPAAPLGRASWFVANGSRHPERGVTHITSGIICADMLAVLPESAVQCRARPEQARSEAVVAYREFVDDAGTMWRVWDTFPAAASALRRVSPTYAEGWLTFECEDERRRLAPIPPDWDRVSGDLIEHWCARALRVRGSPREEPPPEIRHSCEPRGSVASRNEP